MVDDKDKQILFELLQDCRQPLSKIAKTVKLPQQTVSYRIKKLEKDIIKKYTININYSKLGFSRHSLYLDLKGIETREVDKYLKQITDIKEVSCCYTLHEASEWKIYISVWTKTIERYDDIQTKIIKKFKKYINNYLSFQSVKSYTYLARIQNTKEEGREIILIIDESHHTASSEKSKELIEVISPKVTIEISATPHLKENISGWVKVNLSDVKAEEMIKSEIAVNPEFLNLKIGTKTSDEIVIEQALKKREELVKLNKKEGSDINPLVLVQLPDQKGNLINKKDDVLQILKDKFKITEENGKLAVWLSEEKTETLANVEKNDNEVEVLVFKQAIALGWDCPRASILVIFRESKSFTFTIQTIGRIMRMPELKYYNEEELNLGFVFTNLPNIEITEDYAKDYVTIYEAKRDNTLYKDISLPSIYMKRQRERTRLSGEFGKIFMKIAEEINLKKKITAEPSKTVSPIIADGKIIDIDKAGEIEHKGQINIQLNEIELRQAWDKFITQNCTPYAPADSSDRMKTAIYQFFKEKYKLDKYDPRVQRIVLGKENVRAFVDAINLAKEEYKIKIVEKLSKVKEKKEVPKWEVPIIISYNSRYKKEEHSKSIVKPFYTAKPSEPETKFIELLNKSNKVKWWFKNGETEIKYFAVLRTDGFTFYPDFLVQFKDDSIVFNVFKELKY